MGQAAGGKERQLAAQPPLTNGFAGGGDRLFCYRCLWSLGHRWQHAAVSASNRSCSASATPPGCCKPTSCSQSACVCLASPAFRAWGRSEETGQYTRSGEEVCERANTPEQGFYLLVCVRRNRRSTSRAPSVWPPAGYPRACFCPVRKQSAWGRRVASGVRALCNNATDSCPFSTPESHWSPLCTHHKLPTSWMMPWSRFGKRSPRSHPSFHRGRPERLGSFGGSWFKLLLCNQSRVTSLRSGMCEVSEVIKRYIEVIKLDSSLRYSTCSEN